PRLFLIDLRFPLDRRPIRAGLLHASRVRYDMAVQRVLSASRHPFRTAVYGAAGMDFSNFLLSMGGAGEGEQDAWFLARYGGLTYEVLRDFLSDPEGYLRGEMNFKAFARDYRDGKSHTGYGYVTYLNKPVQLLAAMRVELEA